MFLATANKTKRLLHLNYIGHVEPVELRAGLEDIKTLLAELPPGFNVLVDYGRLESMDLACATEIGLGMDLIGQRGVGLVVRVIPDPAKDIGLNILAAFHYAPAQRPKIVTCENLTEAARVLAW